MNIGAENGIGGPSSISSFPRFIYIIGKGMNLSLLVPRYGLNSRVDLVYSLRYRSVAENENSNFRTLKKPLERLSVTLQWNHGKSKIIMKKKRYLLRNLNVHVMKGQGIQIPL